MRDILDGIQIRTAFKIAHLSNVYREPVYREIEAKYGITRPEITTLLLLGFEDGKTAVEICNFSGLLKTNVSRAVLALEKKGYIVRQADPSDRRRQVLCITDAGRALHDAFFPMLVEREKWMVQSLTKRERDQLDRLLHKLADNVPYWINR